MRKLLFIDDLSIVVIGSLIATVIGAKLKWVTNVWGLYQQINRIKLYRAFCREFRVKSERIEYDIMNNYNVIKQKEPFLYSWRNESRSSPQWRENVKYVQGNIQPYEKTLTAILDHLLSYRDDIADVLNQHNKERGRLEFLKESYSGNPDLAQRGHTDGNHNYRRIVTLDHELYDIQQSLQIQYQKSFPPSLKGFSFIRRHLNNLSDY